MNIQKMFPTEVYQHGLAYFNNDQVSDLLFDINNEVWTATVQGTKEHFVEVNLQDIGQGSIAHTVIVKLLVRTALANILSLSFLVLLIKRKRRPVFLIIRLRINLLRVSRQHAKAVRNMYLKRRPCMLNTIVNGHMNEIYILS